MNILPHKFLKFPLTIHTNRAGERGEAIWGERTGLIRFGAPKLGNRVNGGGGGDGERGGGDGRSLKLKLDLEECPQSFSRWPCTQI